MNQPLINAIVIHGKAQSGISSSDSLGIKASRMLWQHRMHSSYGRSGSRGCDGIGIEWFWMTDEKGDGMPWSISDKFM